MAKTSPAGSSATAVNVEEEKIVREEIRSQRQTAIRLFQAGITLETALLTALVFLRGEWLSFLLEHKLIPEDTLLLPRGAYLFGTLLLLIVAMSFAFASALVARRRRWYGEQLDRVRVTSIVELPPNKWIRWAFRFMYFIFPLIDCIVRFWFEVRVH